MASVKSSLSESHDTYYLLSKDHVCQVPCQVLSTYHFLAFLTNSYMSGIIIIPILQIRKLTLRKVGPCSKTPRVSDLSQHSPFSRIYHFSEEKVCTLTIDGAGFIERTYN